MLTPMMVQYLVGLCCLRHDPDAVEITLECSTHKEQDRNQHFIRQLPKKRNLVTKLNRQKNARFDSQSQSCVFRSQKGGQSMPSVTLSDYFCGDEEMRFTHFRIPRQLITHPQFKPLSADAKLLYGMLLNRMSLSAKNGWRDDDGRVYIYFTIKEVCEAVGCGRNKAIRLLAELDATKGVGLIERVKQGQGKPDRIFVKRITIEEDTETPGQGPDALTSPADFSDVQRSENLTSRSRENRPLEVSKANPSYIDKNQTDFIHTNQSIYPPTPSAERLEMDGYELREEHKENIRYERLQRELFTVNTSQYPYHNSLIQPFYHSIRFWGNSSHGETHFLWTNKGNSYPAPPQRTAPPKGGAVRASMSFVKHKRPLARGESPPWNPHLRKYVSP